VQEAIVYCESNPPELAEDYAREEAVMQATGMNDPSYDGRPKVLRACEFFVPRSDLANSNAVWRRQCGSGYRCNARMGRDGIRGSKRSPRRSADTADRCRQALPVV